MYSAPEPSTHRDGAGGAETQPIHHELLCDPHPRGRRDTVLAGEVGPEQPEQWGLRHT